MGVFEAAGYCAEVARRDDIPALQVFLETNPAYTRLVEGREVASDAAATEFDDEPPAAFAFDRRWLLLVRERASGELVGVIDLVKDLLAPGIWNVGLFLIAERLHGSGVAAELHAALQHWMHGQGARWLRLNVVDRNLRGARFWRRQGYTFICPREWAAPSGRVNTVWTLVKPLAGESLAGYLGAQTRDTLQPEPPGWA